MEVQQIRHFNQVPIVTVVLQRLRNAGFHGGRIDALFQWEQGGLLNQRPPGKGRLLDQRAVQPEPWRWHLLHLGV